MIRRPVHCGGGGPAGPAGRDCDSERDERATPAHTVTAKLKHIWHTENETARDGEREIGRTRDQARHRPPRAGTTFAAARAFVSERRLAARAVALDRLTDQQQRDPERAASTAAHAARRAAAPPTEWCVWENRRVSGGARAPPSHRDV